LLVFVLISNMNATDNNNEKLIIIIIIIIMMMVLVLDKLSSISLEITILLNIITTACFKMRSGLL
jgi:hypothetical protein